MAFDTSKPIRVLSLEDVESHEIIEIAKGNKIRPLSKNSIFFEPNQFRIFEILFPKYYKFDRYGVNYLSRKHCKDYIKSLEAFNSLILNNSIMDSLKELEISSRVQEKELEQINALNNHKESLIECSNKIIEFITNSNFIITIFGID